MLFSSLAIIGTLVALGSTQLSYQATHPYHILNDPAPGLGIKRFAAPTADPSSGVSYPFEVDVPLVLPGGKSCTVDLVDHVFANSFNLPFVGPYKPPKGCPGPWSKVVFEVAGKSRGRQFDRVSGVWIGGV